MHFRNVCIDSLKARFQFYFIRALKDIGGSKSVNRLLIDSTLPFCPFHCPSESRWQR